MANTTPTQTLKKLKKVERTLFASEIGSCLAPFGILTAINFDEYFIQSDAWRTSLSFAMLAGSTIIAICLMAKEKLKLNLVSALTGLIIADVICRLLGSLITDLAYILLFVIIGFVGALGLEIKRKKEVEQIELLNEGIRKAQVDNIANEYNNEQNKKVVKVRIKK